MIRFYCEHCANKISVRDKDVGKQGKCPKCSSAIVVPAESTIIEFHCENCDRKISVPKVNEGKKAVCPKCSNTFIIPATQFPGLAANQNHSGDMKARSADSAHDWTLLDVPEEYKLKDKPAGESNVSEEAIDRQQEYEETESTNRRKLPWLIDIFLYPVTVSGMIHLAIFSFLPRMLLPLGHRNYWLRPPIFGLGFLIIFVGYALYCISDYIRDSANGNRRTAEINLSPNILFNMGELISPIFQMFVCIAVCTGPLLAYFITTKQTDFIFWLLVIYGIIFLPMLLLAMVLFDSFRALNPILIIASMSNVFLPYFGLNLFFCAIGGLVVVIIAIFPQSRIISYLLSGICIYLIMVTAHLLGWFYHRYENKLNWEV